MTWHDLEPVMSLEPIDYDPETFLRERFVLPALPEVVGQLMERINAGKTSAKEISSLIGSDSSLVAQVLRVVNSAYYGLPREITDVTHAVAYLGFGEIYRIVLTVSVTRALEPSHPKEFEHYWRHSFFTALVSKRLAKTYEPTVEPGDVYTASVLHDIGKLVYQRFFPEHYRLMSRFCRENGTFLVDAETHFGNPSHTTFGALLCDRWQLPDDVRRACEFHELAHLRRIHPGDDTGPALRMVCVANLLANLAGESLLDDYKVQVRDEVQRVLECDEEEFLLLMGDVYELKATVARFLERL